MISTGRRATTTTSTAPRRLAPSPPRGALLAATKHVAHDATQEAYVAMWRCWERWTDRSIRDAGSYVVGIALHKVADAFRRRADLPLPDDFKPSNHEPGYDRILNQSLRLSLAELIERQPPRRRAVAMLYFVEGCTYPEIADALQIAKSTVRTHVERMRELMQPLVDIDGPRGGER
jgi:RNA polymerase sigma factor (sigma-70 family)